LTGGYMTLAATLCNARVRDGIAAGDHPVLMHGPTFMANPLACAVASASIDLLCSSPWRRRVARIEQRLRDGLAPCAACDAVADVRVRGAIGVVEMKQPIDVAVVQRRLVEAGVWLRPFGRLLYTMPPYVIDDASLERLIAAMVAIAAGAR
ncbi:MAG: aminotransferase class III-fold pyridoxal phosphate-dependent enzyme, partial [Zetaproteobacteria bacterium]